jgi:hypothetical protein
MGLFLPGIRAILLACPEDEWDTSCKVEESTRIIELGIIELGLKFARTPEERHGDSGGNGHE